MHATYTVVDCCQVTYQMALAEADGGRSWFLPRSRRPQVALAEADGGRSWFLPSSRRPQVALAERVLLNGTWHMAPAPCIDGVYCESRDRDKPPPPPPPLRLENGVKP